MAGFDFSKIAQTIFGGKPAAIHHELKWKIPEARLCAPLESAQPTVAKLRKLCEFKSGGQFYDSIYAKEYGQGAFAYFIVRTEKNTEKETLLFDGYMIQEEDEKLGMNLEAGVEIMGNLASMGYKQEAAREVTEWHFAYHGLPIAVFEIADFGAFVQVSIPATKIEAGRRIAEKNAYAFFEKMGIAKRDIIPTDVITLQVMLARQQQQAGPAQIGTKFTLKDKGAGGNSIF